MSSTVQKIKERLSIADVVSSYVDLEKSGASLKARCPFHNEKSPSFFVSPDRGSFYCFGCGAKGDIFEFVQAFENVDFLTALKMLADKAGVPIEERRVEEKDETGRIYLALEGATEFFKENLKNNKEALLYLKNRGLSIDMLRLWRLGFASLEWRDLRTHLKGKGFSDKEMMLAGLIKENEKGGEAYDRFRGRVMFPIFDTSGRVIGFSGRILDSKDSEAKYLNSPDTLLFDKSKTLYGYDRAKLKIRETNSVILVEGQMDLLLSHQAEFQNTVASSGTALTLDHLKILRRLTSNLLIAYDADSAGRNATFRAWQMALSLGFVVKIIPLKDGIDPADAIKENIDTWRELVKGAIDILDYFGNIMMEESDVEQKDKILKEKILPLLASIESAIDKSRYIQAISYKSGVSENALWEELSKIKFDVVNESFGSGTIKPKETNNAGTDRIISFLFYLESKNDPYSEVFRGKTAELKSVLIDDDRIDKQKLIFEAELQYGAIPSVEVGNELLMHLEEEILKKEFALSMEALKKAEALHDQKRVDEELIKCQNISSKLGGLAKKYLIVKN